MFSFQAKLGSDTAWIEFLADDVDNDPTGNFAPVTATVMGGASCCDDQRCDSPTLKLTIDHIAQSKPHRPASFSKRSFEGSLKCQEGGPVSLQGSWDC